jgi:hypothetical protein
LSIPDYGQSSEAPNSVACARVVNLLARGVKYPLQVWRIEGNQCQGSFKLRRGARQTFGALAPDGINFPSIRFQSHRAATLLSTGALLEHIDSERTKRSRNSKRD